MIIPSWLQNLVPPLPPGPAPPPSTGGQTGGSGTPDDPAVILVIGQRPPPGPPVGYGPYGGMTGAEARAARDMAWAMGTPEDRVRAMGLDPYASITADDGSGLYRLVDDLELQGTNDYLQWAAEEFSNSIDNYQVGRAGEALAREKISQLGYTIEGEQVRVKVRMEDGTWKLRVYDFLVRRPDGQREFIEVKTNTEAFTPDQIAADTQLRRGTGVMATSRLPGYPNGTPPPSNEVGFIRVTF